MMRHRARYATIVLPFFFGLTCVEPPGDPYLDVVDAADDGAVDAPAPPCVFEGETLALGYGGRTLDAVPVDQGFAVLLDGCYYGFADLVRDLHHQVIRRTAAGGPLPVQIVSRSTCGVATAWNGEEFGLLGYSDPAVFSSGALPDFGRVSSSGAMFSSTRLAEACSGEAPGAVAIASPCRLLPRRDGWLLVAQYLDGLAWRTLASDGTLGPRIYRGLDAPLRGFSWGEAGPVVLYRLLAERVYEVLRYDADGTDLGPPVLLDDIEGERAVYGGPLAPAPAGFVMAYVVGVGETAVAEDCRYAACTVELRLVFLSPAAEPLGSPVAVERMTIGPIEPLTASPVMALEAPGPQAFVAYRFASAGGDVLRLRAVRQDGAVSEPLDLSMEWQVGYVTIRQAPAGDLFVGYSTHPSPEGPLDARAWLGSCR